MARNADRAEPARYDHAEVEPRWQRYWDEHADLPGGAPPGPRRSTTSSTCSRTRRARASTSATPRATPRPTSSARYKRMRGFNVLHPMGWDAFGLPAEQYAIKTGTHPRDDDAARTSTTFRRQLKTLGFSYDWSREVDTTDPGYFRWTQWIFLQLFERGLAYQAEVPVNWCPALGTVLANEEVVDGKSERRRLSRSCACRCGSGCCGSPPTPIACSTTSTALDWPEARKKMQRDWIGRSEGAEVDFAVDGHASATIERLHHAARHALRRDLHGARARAPARRRRSRRPSSARAVRRVRRRRPRARATSIAPTRRQGEDRRLHRRLRDQPGQRRARSRSGSPTTCSAATAPARSWPCPRTTSATSSSPSAFGLPIVEVVSPDGTLARRARRRLHRTTASPSARGEFDGLPTPEMQARRSSSSSSERASARGKVNYKLRDWLFSRQRYWGEPFPIYFPVEMRAAIRAHGRAATRSDYDQPIAARRERAAARSCPSSTTSSPATIPRARSRAPLDWRFFQKDGKLVRARDQHDAAVGRLVLVLPPLPRPAERRASPGRRQAYDALDARRPLRRRRRARGAAPALRALLAQGALRPRPRDAPRAVPEARPPGHDPRREQREDVEVARQRRQPRRRRARVRRRRAPRSTRCSWARSRRSSPGSRRRSRACVRFRDRAVRDGRRGRWRDAIDDATRRLLHKTVKKVTRDIEAMRFNTAICGDDGPARTICSDLPDPLPREAVRTLIAAPLAVRAARRRGAVAEARARRGAHGTLAYQAWPTYDEALCLDDVVEIAVQVNGKVRGRVVLAATPPRRRPRRAALGADGVARARGGQDSQKVRLRARQDRQRRRSLATLTSRVDRPRTALLESDGPLCRLVGAGRLFGHVRAQALLFLGNLTEAWNQVRAAERVAEYARELTAACRTTITTPGLPATN